MARIRQKAQQRAEECPNNIAKNYAKSVKTRLRQFEEWKKELHDVIDGVSTKVTLSMIKDEWLCFRPESIDEMFTIEHTYSTDGIPEETSTDKRNSFYNNASTHTDISRYKQNRDGSAAGCYARSNRLRVGQNAMKKDKRRDEAFESANKARNEYREAITVRNPLQVEQIYKAEEACVLTTKRHDDEFHNLEHMRRLPPGKMKESDPLHGMIYAEVSEIFPTGPRGGGTSKKWDRPTDLRITIRVGSLASVTEVMKTL